MEIRCLLCHHKECINLYKEPSFFESPKMPLENLTQKQIKNRKTLVGRFLIKHTCLSVLVMMTGITVLSLGIVYGAKYIVEKIKNVSKIEYKIENNYITK